MFRHAVACLSVFHHSTIPPFHHSNLPFFHHSILPLFHFSIIPSFHYSNIPPFHHSNLPSFHFSTIPFFHSLISMFLGVLCASVLKFSTLPLLVIWIDKNLVTRATCSILPDNTPDQKFVAVKEFEEVNSRTEVV